MGRECEDLSSMQSCLSVCQLTPLWLGLQVILNFLTQNQVFQLILFTYLHLRQPIRTKMFAFQFSCHLSLTQYNRKNKSSFVWKKQDLHPWDFCLCCSHCQYFCCVSDMNYRECNVFVLFGYIFGYLDGDVSIFSYDTKFQPAMSCCG